MAVDQANDQLMVPQTACGVNLVVRCTIKQTFSSAYRVTLSKKLSGEAQFEITICGRTWDFEPGCASEVDPGSQLGSSFVPACPSTSGRGFVRRRSAYHWWWTHCTEPAPAQHKCNHVLFFIERRHRLECISENRILATAAFLSPARITIMYLMLLHKYTSNWWVKHQTTNPPSLHFSSQVSL